MKDQNHSDVGFASYIQKYGPDDQACWLTPDWLWDYFFTRESDFSDKDTKVAEYIRHYEESKHLTMSDEGTHRVFKTAMLLLAVTSSAKNIYGASRAHGGIAATVDCLCSCLAGVMSREHVQDLLKTLEENKLLILDTGANGIVRIQLPFRSTVDEIQNRKSDNEKKDKRYQMFSKDGVLAK